MRVRLKSGEVVTIPDGLTPEQTMAELDRASLPKPTTLGYVGGALKEGALRLAELGMNASDVMDDLQKSGAIDPAAIAGGPTETYKQNVRADIAVERATPSSRAYKVHSEALPWYGKLGTGALEFLPQMPLYEAFGGAALKAASGIPKVGKLAQALAPVAGDPFVKGWGRAVGRAAVSGGATGFVAGVPGGTPLSERLTVAGEEAVGFAGAVGVLHPVGKVLGAGAKSLWNRGAKRRGKLAPEGESQIEETVQAPAEPEISPIVITPEEEEVVRLRVSKNDFKRFKRLGYNREDLLGMEGGEFVSILKERKVKSKIESAPETPETIQSEMEPVGAKQEGGLEAPKQEVEQPDTSNQKLNVGRDPAKIRYLQMAGWQGKEIRKMTPEAFEENYRMAREAGQATNTPEDIKRISVFEEKILGKKEEKASITEAFKEPKDLAEEENSLKLLDEAKQRWAFEDVSEEDAQAIADLIFDGVPEAEPILEAAVKKATSPAIRAETAMERFRSRLQELRDKDVVDVKKLTKEETKLYKAGEEPAEAKKPKTLAEWEEFTKEGGDLDRELGIGEEGLEEDISFARRAAKISVLDNEYGMLVGGGAESFKEALSRGKFPEGAFSSIHDRKVRREISDQDAELTSAYGQLDEMRLSEAVKQLRVFDEYPETKNIRVKKFSGRISTGFFDSLDQTVWVHEYLTKESTLDTILHETQHWVQWKENWSLGGSPENYRVLLSGLKSLEKVYLARAKNGVNADAYRHRWQLTRQLQSESRAVETRIKEIDDERVALEKNLDELRKLLSSRERSGADIEEILNLRNTLNAAKANGNRRISSMENKLKTALSMYSDIAYDAYRLIAGEAEAFSTSARKELSDLERSRRDPYDSAGIASEVPPSGWINIAKGVGDATSLMAEKVLAKKKEANTTGAKVLLSLENGKTLTEISPARQASAWRQYFFTPLEVNKANPIADRYIFDLNKAELGYSHSTAQHGITLRDAISGLSDVEQVQVRQVLEGKATGSLKVQEAALKVRKFLDVMREKYKQHLRELYAKHLSPEENVALRELIQGRDLAVVAATHQYKYTKREDGKLTRKKNIDPKVLESIAKEYSAIDGWGIDDYLPNYERGKYKMLVDGKLIGVGLSRADAERKALKFWKDHPDKPEIYLDTEFSSYDVDATGLSRNQYWAIQSKLKKAIEKKISGLEKGVATAVAREAMGKEFIIKPTSVFSPFTKPRNEVFAGEENIFPVLFKYAYSMEKKMALDPILEGIRKDAGKISDPRIRENLLSLAADVKGQYWLEDKIADGILGWASKDSRRWEPSGNAASRFVRFTGTIETNLKLAYRPVAGTINFASGQGHIWVKFGTVNLAKGWQFYQTAEGKRLLNDLRPMLGQTFVQEGTGMSLTGPLEKLGILKKGSSPLGNALKDIAEPLGVFSVAEIPNRDVAALTSYLVAKEGGLGEEAAKEFALRSTWFTEFTYNTASLGQFMRRPTGRLLFKFKPYLVKELEFIGSLRDPVEIARYIALQTALAGPRGFIYLARSIPVLSLVLPAMFWDKIEEWANTNYPRASRGIGGFLGVDITAPAMFQLPQSAADWFGPLASDLSKIRAEWSKIIEGEEVGSGNLRKLAGSIAPALKYWGKIWDQIVDKDGWVKNERGQRVYHIDNQAAYLAKNLAAAEDLPASQIRTEERILNAREATLDQNKKKTVDRVLDAVEGGGKISDGLMQDMVRYNVQMSSLRRAQRFRALDAKTRKILMTEISRRPEILELYPELPAPP
jgi:hypothetical protein